MCNSTLLRLLQIDKSSDIPMVDLTLVLQSHCCEQPTGLLFELNLRQQFHFWAENKCKKFQPKGNKCLLLAYEYWFSSP